MPNVKVVPIQQVKVRINQGTQQTVHNTTQFIGAGSPVDVVARNLANTAFILANSAYATANTKYDKIGGPISGDVNIYGNLITNSFSANTLIVDAGTF